MAPEGDLGPLATKLALAAFDVDGVMTDGRLYLGPDGAEYKAFHVRDGLGLKRLQNAGIQVAVITGRTSAVVSARMKELGIEHVYQGVADKLACMSALLETLGLEARHASYMGDDLPDLPVMQAVGLPVAVADACAEVRASARVITQAFGGCGAVREFSDLLIALRTGHCT